MGRCPTATCFLPPLFLPRPWIPWSPLFCRSTGRNCRSCSARRASYVQSWAPSALLFTMAGWSAVVRTRMDSSWWCGGDDAAALASAAQLLEAAAGFLTI